MNPFATATGAQPPNSQIQSNNPFDAINQMFPPQNGVPHPLNGMMTHLMQQYQAQGGDNQPNQMFIGSGARAVGGNR